MEGYMEENNIEQEYPETENGTDTAELFTDTVSGNDTGADTPADGAEETLPEESGQEGQEGLLESLNALVEALTPSEEDAEAEEGTGTETESLPSETETAVLELLEKIYAETAAGRAADDLYHEAWTECQTASQEKEETLETQRTYMIVILLGILFLCACITGIQIARAVWERFL